MVLAKFLSMYVVFLHCTYVTKFMIYDNILVIKFTCFFFQKTTLDMDNL